MPTPLKVLDLYSGSQSVKKTLKENNILYDYFGFDIKTFNNDNIILDLSEDNIVEKIIKKLPWGWKPDIVWSSPPCQAFSRTVAIVGGTLSFELTEDKKLKLRQNWKIEHKTYKHKRDDYLFRKKHTEKGKISTKMVDNTFKIIDYFEPKKWFVENPANGLFKYYVKNIRKYKFDEFENYTDYCAYGFPYKKRTLIYSNYQFNLKKCSHKLHSIIISGSKKKKPWQKLDGGKGYNRNYERSKVPTGLIKDCINKHIFKWSKKN